jgi:GMP synthase (glutamine-hydrolysing)
VEILTDPPTKPGRPRRARTATKTVSAFRHVHFEDLGVFAPIFLESGYEVSVYDAGIDDLRAVEAEDPDILVVLGGPIGANDEADFPFLEDERRIIENRLSGNRPTLGVCLGAQLIARAAGGKVFPGGMKEIGWSALTLSADGLASPLRHLNGPVLHWHGDTFELPPYATHLASTSSYANQAFALGQNVLGLQFHAEIDCDQIERWLIGHACDLILSGANVSHLRSDTRRFGAAMQAASSALLRDWLAHVAVR